VRQVGVNDSGDVPRVISSPQAHRAIGVCAYSDVDGPRAVGDVQTMKVKALSVVGEERSVPAPIVKRRD